MLGSTPPLPSPFSQFEVPLFLLAIYQAAAIQYDVPWQVLAAINQVETNFGSDLSVSSAGAEGWMQFLPSTWARYGLDVSNAGAANPYDPVDAIFAAARYLQAAGAATDLRGAIFAYNHSTTYVDSVLADSKQIALVPSPIVDALSGMSDGLFPVHAKAAYESIAGPSQATLHTDIFARTGAPVIASETGRIVAIGGSRQLGHFVKLRDSYGTTYTYAQLGSVAASYPIPRSNARAASPVVRVFRTANLVAPLRHPISVAAVGQGSASATPVSLTPAATGSQINSLSAGTFTAGPDPKSLAGSPQLDPAPLVHYTPTVRSGLQFRGSQARWLALRAGAVVYAGTVLGRIGDPVDAAPHLRFMIRPAAAGGPLIDPGPVLDGWRLRERATVDGVAHPKVGQALLMSHSALAGVVLSDSRIKIPRRDRADIATGQIDRRVMAMLEFLADSGLRPTVTAVPYGRKASALLQGGAFATGDAVEIGAINGVRIRDHAITEKTVRRLVALQGVMQPARIISRINLPDADNTVARNDLGGHIEVVFQPRFGNNVALKRSAIAALSMAGPAGGVWASTEYSRVSAPPGVPPAVTAVITAGNAIATLPYIWGGGHGSFQAPGYDCSGSVSYALAAAGFVSSPLVSGQFENWGLPGPGRWITVYANADHVWMTVDGWRFDTVALADAGTRWARSGGEFSGFVVRHPAGL